MKKLAFSIIIFLTGSIISGCAREDLPELPQKEKYSQQIDASSSTQTKPEKFLYDAEQPIPLGNNQMEIIYSPLIKKKQSEHKSSDMPAPEQIKEQKEEKNIKTLPEPDIKKIRAFYMSQEP